MMKKKLRLFVAIVAVVALSATGVYAAESLCDKIKKKVEVAVDLAEVELAVQWSTVYDNMGCNEQ